VRTLVVVAALAVLAGCEQGAAPRDWAARHGVDTGGATPIERPAVDPKNVAPHVEPQPGRDRLWVGVITGVVGITGIVVAAGVWLLEARRRMRRLRDGLCAGISDRLRREQFDEVAVTRGDVPLFRGGVTVGLKGTVMSEKDRRRVLAIAADEVRRGQLPADVVDDVSVRGARRVG
jgi:hypothetical protein